MNEQRLPVFAALAAALSLALAAGVAAFVIRSEPRVRPAPAFENAPRVEVDATPPAATTIANPDYFDAITNARRVARDNLGIGLPGLSIAVSVGGEIVWAEGFGWADIEQGMAVTPRHKFRIGSVSKPMTAAALALLWEEGAIDLDLPVQTYVPDFPEKEFPITTRQLAGHLAGIRHYRGDEFVSSLHYPTVSDGLEIFANDALLHEPGSAYQYSSYGWNLISAVIEGASQSEFLELMQARVFDPLGLRQTAPDQNLDVIPHRVSFYSQSPAGNGRFINGPYVDNSYKWAGGGFLSTPSDLVRFASAHLEPGYLRAETLELLFTSQTLADGTETGYGIGWGVRDDPGGRRLISHGGGSVGGTTMLAMWPEEKLVVAMATNLSSAPALRFQEIAEAFLAR